MLWDPKPPLVHELVAGISFLTGENVLHLHMLSSVLMATSCISVVSLLFKLVFDYTNDSTAAFAAGFTMLTYPVFYLLPVGGLRPKMFVLLFGLLSVYLLNLNLPFISGACAAAAAGSWQFGLFFPVLVAFRTIRRSSRSFGWALAGMGLTTFVVVFPFILRDSTGPMLAQVIVSMFVASEPFHPFERVIIGGGALDFAIPIVLLGASGALTAIRDQRHYWILAGLGWFGTQVLFFDLDGGADLVPAFTFVALGMALLVHHASPRGVRWILATLGVVAAVMFWWHGGLSGFVPPQTPLESGSVEWLYWQTEIPDTCHIRLSQMEREFIESTGSSVSEQFCSGEAAWNYL